MTLNSAGGLGAKMLYILLVVQMVVVPVAPVLAQETALEEPVPAEVAPAVEALPTPVEVVVPESVAPLVEADVQPSVVSEVVAPVEAPAPATEAVEVAPVVVEASTQIEAAPSKPVSYVELMREWRDAKEKGGSVAPMISKSSSFITSERERLSGLGLSEDRIERYIGRLRSQFAMPTAAEQGVLARLKSLVTEPDPVAELDEAEPAMAPEFPAKFNFYSPQIEIGKASVSSESMRRNLRVEKTTLRDLFSVDVVFASPASLPTLADVAADGTQVEITSDMQAVVDGIGRNPVAIYNYVRETISYEPYFGAKKGAYGCFREKSCNDVDASSLLIALMRAAGIPARYVKGVAVMPVKTVRELVGVDETKTAYAALYVSRVPVFTVSGNPIGANYEAADFSNEQYLGVDWTAVEVFYDYDERGGNFPNVLDFTNTTTTEAVRAIVGGREKQWIQLDAVVTPATRTKNEIVADAAGFNGQTFWNSFLQYQGNLSPVEKYAADLQAQTGKDITTPLYQSGSAKAYTPATILPPTLPYELAEGTDANGNVISIERWSVMPADRVLHITVSLKRAANNEVVLQTDLPAAQFLNTPFALSYHGATEQDAAAIESYGGIAYTPAELVLLTPRFGSDANQVQGNANVAIGESLIFDFSYYKGAELLYRDQKFSVAGNEEGVYIASSKVLNDPGVTSPEQALFAGNASIAREYLKKNVERRELLANSLDRLAGVGFLRAVVTQNRVLSKVNGVPTTFDFKGLSIDVAAYTSDFSRRGHYKDREREYRLLYGLESSFYEAQVFTDLAHLDGISTIKGLQHAYANPGTYTMHVITGANEAVIDGLALSPNTKANMHADVQKGHTITTPDKAVTKGAFTGLLYTSIAPDFTGTYAIGEQVQNGGDTTDLVTIAGWKDANAKDQYAYEVVKGLDKFIFKDDSSRNIFCNIKLTTYNSIVNGVLAPGWNKAQHGLPCMDDTPNSSYKFGGHDHRFIAATDGAYFKSNSDGYDYWVRNATIFSQFYQAAPNDPLYSFKQIYPYWGTYVYNRSVGRIARYIVYSPAKSQSFKLEGGPAARYVSSNKLFDTYIPGHLGFPIMNEASAAPYKSTTGKYQQFTNGTIYRKDFSLLHSDGVITFGLLDKQISDAGGTSVTGFPNTDPEQRNGYRYQLLQSDQDIWWKLADNTSGITPHIKYNCTFFGDYADHWYDAPKMTFVHLHGIFDSGVATVGSLADLAKSQLEEALYNPASLPLLTGPLSIVNTILPYTENTNYQQMVQFFRNAPTQVSQFLINEYDTSFGKKGCQARQWYIEGRLAGEFLQVYLTKAVTLESKMSVVSKLDDYKYVSQVTDLTEESAKTFAGLAKSGPFMNKSLFRVAQRYIDNGEAAWYTKPLLNDDFQLKAAINANYLRGDLQYGFYSLNKALTDSYLLNLSKAGDEIIYVLKQDGQMIIAPRGNYKIPHPILSGGESVREAGVIKLLGNNSFEITNVSGHFTPSASGLNDVYSAVKFVLPGAKITIKPF